MPLKDQLADPFKLLGYHLIYYLVRFVPARQAPKRLLLAKTDEIGDYILVRNFLSYFRQTGPYKDHHITFVGNAQFRTLYERFDASFADEVIWLDKKKFRRNLRYRFQLLKRIRKAGFSDAVNLVYSRRFRENDVLVAVSSAANRMAMALEALPIPMSRFERLLSPANIYNRLIDAGSQGSFDACKNALFVGQLVGTTIPPTVRIPGVPAASFSLPANYFVVFPGSRDEVRRWPAAYFAAVTRFVADELGFEPVVCGAPDEMEAIRQFIAEYGRPVTDLAGKTSLTEFLSVLKTARCIISVDTGAVHLAASVGCPVFGLFSGRYYGRFAPYPREIAPGFVAIYPDEIEEQIRKGQLPDINTIPIDLLRKIPPEKVIARIREHFSAIQ